MPSERAQRYLASLERLTPVPTARVEQVLKDQGSPCFPAWLEFHERYAGHVEPIGLERAVWGLVHAQSRWVKPFRAVVTPSLQAEADWLITCAEVHPSYVYQLGDTGFFKVRGADSFELRLERAALRVDFFARPGAQALYAPADDAALSAGATQVAEASDGHYQALVGARFFGIRKTDTGQWVDRATCG